MRGAGLPYRDVEDRGFYLPLIDVSLRLRATVSYDDSLVIETWIEEIRSRSVAFAYRLLHDAAVTATGRTVHACVRAADRRSVTLPPWLVANLAPLSN